MLLRRLTSGVLRLRRHRHEIVFGRRTVSVAAAADDDDGVGRIRRSFRTRFDRILRKCKRDLLLLKKIKN